MSRHDDHFATVVEGNHVSHEIEVISPAVAKAFLESNTKNRQLSASHVEYLAGQMKRGEWRFTGEPIVFDRLGQLQDGQHRLHALVKADIDLPFLIVSEVGEEALYVRDTGKKREARDAVSLSGYADTSTLAAAARALHEWNNGTITTAMSRQTPRSRPSNLQVLRLVEGTPMLPDAIRLSRRVYQTIRLAPASMAAAFTVLMHIDPEKATEFASALAALDGSPAISALAKRVSADQRNQMRYAIGTVFYLLFSTWNAWLTGTQRTRYQFGSKEHGWTNIPTPMSPKEARA